MNLDPDVQKAALNIINNLVCGPHSRGIVRALPGISKKKASGKTGEDLLSKMWGLIRANHGIMVSICSDFPIYLYHLNISLVNLFFCTNYTVRMGHANYIIITCEWEPV